MSMTPAEMIAVIQAYQDGKTIECRFTDQSRHSPEWIVATPSWQFDQLDYRVKPVPKELFAVFIAGGKLAAAWTNEVTAKGYAKSCYPELKATVVRMQEVL